MRPFPHERFSREVSLSPEGVSAFAEDVGDTNPVHHDPEFAKTTRFGRPIASGTHTTALLLALTARHYSDAARMLGLEFWVRFRKAIFADETIRLEWLVIRVTRNERLRGDIVDLRGRIRNARGETVLGAKGKILVADTL